MTQPHQIAFSPPDIGGGEIQEVTAALQSGWITTGPRTKKFERVLSPWTGDGTVVCLNSATAALELTLRILGIGPGDEVIVPAYTYTASASVIDHVGAKIVMCDCGVGRFEMDYKRLPQLVTSRTKAVIPVDLGGRLCDYDKISAALEGKKALYRPETPMQRHFDRVPIIADAAHALGAKQKDGQTWRRAGEWADFTAFSFHAVKNLTTAEGGAVTWRKRPGLDDAGLYHEFQLLSLHGQSKDALAKNQLGAWEYDIVYTGYKCNMTDVLASLGLKQLERYQGMLDRRHAIIRRYNEVAERHDCAVLCHEDEKNLSSGHLYLLRVPGFDETRRNALIVALAEAGIACNVHYKPLPMMTAYRRMGFGIEDYPRAFAQYQNELTLPLHTCLSDADVDYVCETLDRLLTAAGR